MATSKRTTVTTLKPFYFSKKVRSRTGYRLLGDGNAIAAGTVLVVVQPLPGGLLEVDTLDGKDGGVIKAEWVA